MWEKTGVFLVIKTLTYFFISDKLDYILITNIKTMVNENLQPITYTEAEKFVKLTLKEEVLKALQASRKENAARGVAYVNPITIDNIEVRTEPENFVSWSGKFTIYINYDEKWFLPKVFKFSWIINDADVKYIEAYFAYKAIEKQKLVIQNAYRATLKEIEKLIQMWFDISDVY